MPSPEISPLALDDVRAMVRLLAEVAVLHGDLAAKKRAFMDGLSAIIGADRWAWGLARNVAPGEPSQHLSLIHGGFTEETYAAFTQAYQHPSMTEVHTPFVEEQRARGGHLTRMRQQIDPDGRAYANGSAPYWAKAGIDAVIMSLYPLSDDHHSLVGLYRRPGAPPFSPRENRIAHIMLAEVPGLHTDGWPLAQHSPLPSLSTRERMITDLLVQGFSRAKIAGHLGLSVHTVNEYVRAVFQHFGVHSQASLIARFRDGDGGDA